MILTVVIAVQIIILYFALVC